MARRFQNPPRARRTANRTWAGNIGAAQIGVGPATKVLLGGFSLAAAGIDETVLRTVGQIAIQSDQNAASEFQIGAFGLIVVTDAAVAVGVTAIPGPVTDASDDGWFVYVPFGQAVNFASATGIRPYSNPYTFDSKAKRRVQDGQQIAIMVENAHATHAFNIMTTFRLLTMVTGT